MAKRPGIIETTFDQLIRDATREPRRVSGAARPRVPSKTRNNPDLEKYQQHDGCKLLSSIGAAVYTIGTRRSRGKPCPKCKTFVPEDQGTRQTPGISDVLAFLPPKPGPSRVALWWEAKHADGGRVSPEQRDFAELCRLSSQAHCLGPVDELIAWLVTNGYLSEKNLPHYRLPANRRQS